MMNQVQQKRYDEACKAAAKSVAGAIERGYSSPDWMDDFDKMFVGGAISLFRPEDIEDLTSAEMAVILCGDMGQTLVLLSRDGCEGVNSLARHVLYMLSFAIMTVRNDTGWVNDDLSELEADDE